MATFLDDHIDTSLFVLDHAPDPPKSSKQHASLNAVRQLSHADRAELVVFDRLRGSASVVHADEGPFGAPWLDGAAQLRARGMMASGARTRQPHWIEARLDGKGGALIVPVAEQPLSETFLILRFVDASPEVRRHAVEAAPALARLIASPLDLEARIAAMEAERAAAMAALEQANCGIIVVRADHSIVLANRTASDLLQRSGALQLRRNTVRPTSYHEAIRFEAAVDAALQACSAERPRARLMLLPSEESEAPLIAVITPAITGDAAPSIPMALIHVLQPDAGDIRGLDTLCELLGLSRVETRLVSHLYVGLTIAEAAGEMRIKVETARAYLKQIFAKTGLHRQADLMALLSRYLRAVRAGFDFRAA